MFLANLKMSSKPNTQLTPHAVDTTATGTCHASRTPHAKSLITPSFGVYVLLHRNPGDIDSIKFQSVSSCTSDTARSSNYCQPKTLTSTLRRSCQPYSGGRNWCEMLLCSQSGPGSYKHELSAGLPLVWCTFLGNESVTGTVSIAVIAGFPNCRTQSMIGSLELSIWSEN